MKKLYLLIILSLIVTSCATNNLYKHVTSDLIKMYEIDTIYSPNIIIDFMPKEFWKVNDRKLAIKGLEMHNRNKDKTIYDSINNLKIGQEFKCNNRRIRLINFNLFKHYHSDYFNKETLNYNYHIYNKKNVHYDSINHILYVKEKLTSMMLWEKDSHKWKYIIYVDNYDSFSKMFSKSFIKCLKRQMF